MRRTYRELPLFAILMELDRLYSSFWSLFQVAADRVNFTVEELSHHVDFAESKFQFVEFVGLNSYLKLRFPIIDFNSCQPCLYC